MKATKTNYGWEFTGKAFVQDDGGSEIHPKTGEVGRIQDTKKSPPWLGYPSNARGVFEAIFEREHAAGKTTSQAYMAASNSFK